MTRLSAAAAAVLLAGGLTACGNDDAETTATTPPPESTPAETTDAETTDAPDDDTESTDDATQSTDSPASGALEAGDSLPAAGATAMETVLAEHPGDVIELDWDNQRNRWQVEVLTADEKVEVYTNAEGTEITEVDDREAAEQKHRDRVAAVEVSITDAINQVMAEYPGVFDEAQLDDENGRIVWEVEIDDVNGTTDDVEVYVDVTTGEMWLDD